uniref:Potassium calcium-activated channel subfamily M regulatory beta subunit 3 n=1 Tax=Cynoglossus semilaevis TaxID=244447 RepID=A0A3P8WGE4_CYNSE
MFLNTTSPRRSFSVPININLQGARQRARSLVPVSSVGEDRAILLGFTMMAFSVLMFFVVSMTVIKPLVTSNWEEKTSCVLVQADILREWVDCRGVSTVPCLRVTVNLTGTNQSAVLHFNEESVLFVPQCFYVPKCRMDITELQDEAQRVKRSLEAQLGGNSSCYTDRTKNPGSVILNRKYTWRKALSALLWPVLMLAGGALLVGLVKLTQCLAHLSAEVSFQAGGNRLAGRYNQGKLYRLLRRSSTQAPT